MNEMRGLLNLMEGVKDAHSAEDVIAAIKQVITPVSVSDGEILVRNKECNKLRRWLVANGFSQNRNSETNAVHFTRWDKDAVVRVIDQADGSDKNTFVVSANPYQTGLREDEAPIEGGEGRIKELEALLERVLSVAMAAPWLQRADGLYADIEAALKNKR